jgi:hypothetical protein
LLRFIRDLVEAARVFVLQKMKKKKKNKTCRFE